MGDIKRLFRRDRIYWLIMAVILLGVICLGGGIFDSDLNEGVKNTAGELEFWNHYSEWLVNTTFDDLQIPFDNVELMMFALLELTFVAQALKLFAQEARGRMEVGRVLPIKSWKLLTYHYLSGFLLIGLAVLVQMVSIRLYFLHLEKVTGIAFESAGLFWQTALKTVIIFFVHYALLLWCRRVTNHLPAAVGTFVLLEWAIQAIAVDHLNMQWRSLTDGRVLNWAAWAILALILILLSYLADYKKDDARNGFYAFPIVHGMMMLIVFGELCAALYDAISWRDIPRTAIQILSAAASLGITTGVHYLTKPKKV